MEEQFINPITVKIESYGAIERQLPHDLSVQCETDSFVSEVLHQIIQQYFIEKGIMQFQSEKVQ